MTTQYKDEFGPEVASDLIITEHMWSDSKLFMYETLIHDDFIIAHEQANFCGDAIIIYDFVITARIIIPANSCMKFNFSSSIVKKLTKKRDTMFILETRPNYSGPFIIPKLTFSKEDTSIPYAFIINHNGWDKLSTHASFRIRFYKDVETEKNIHMLPLFVLDPEDEECGVPHIVDFERNFDYSHVINIRLNEEYSIRPLEELTIPCKFYFNSSTPDFMDLFIVLEKFACYGIVVRYDPVVGLLRIINFGYCIVNLGSVFLGLILPTPLCFSDEIFENNALLYTDYTINPSRYVLNFNKK